MNYSNVVKLWTANKLERSAVILIGIICNSFSLNAQISDTITFDALQNQNKLTTQLFSQGVVFPFGVYVYRNNLGKVGIISGSIGSEFNEGPMIIEFTSEKSRVELLGSSYNFSNTTATLKAFDKNGTLIATNGPQNVTNVFPKTPFKIQLQSVVIKRIEFEIPGVDFEVIDDLSFDGNINSTTPMDKPKIKLTQSNISQQTSQEANKLILKGIVTGHQLIPTAKIILNYSHSPFDHSGPSISTVSLVPSSGGKYTFSHEITNPPFGLLDISIIVQNIAGVSDTQHVLLQNTVTAIEKRLIQEYTVAGKTFGAFLWGSRKADTILFVYEKLAIAAYGKVGLKTKGISYSTSVVHERILDKWLSVKNEQDGLKLGLPLKEQQVLNNSISQDFEGGRIYDHDSLGIFYVPKVFAQAIDVSGKEISCGFPIMDPVYATGSIENQYTWLFQKFWRKKPFPNMPELLTSTFEIKGIIPELFIERQGGDLSYSNDVPNYCSATIMEEYKCDGIYGPCNFVNPVQLQARRLQSPQSYCKNGTSYEDKFNAVLEKVNIVGKIEAAVLIGGTNLIGPGNIPIAALQEYLGVEWPAINGDNTLTSVFGIISESKHATDDFPFSHTYYTEPCPITPSPIPGIAGQLSIEDVLQLADIFTEEKGREKLVCPSDWDIKMIPLKSYEFLLGEGKSTIKAEIEDYYFRPFRFGYGDPSAGDLCFAAGRWVIDCGHSAFNTEIHPPAVLVYMRGEKFNNKNATLANVWVNNFYTGQDVSFNIYPPPRPTPSARLIVVSEKEVAYKMSVKESYPLNYLTITLSSTEQQTSAVSSFGELEWSLGGGTFRGKYHVYWEE
jgi:hypothetical protein